MNAFLVSEKHVLTIAKEYVRRVDMDEGDIARILYIAKLLWSANVKSVNYQYDRSNRRGKINIANLDLAAKFTETELLKLVNCLDYQSCEYPEWGKSPAKKILRELAENLVTHGATMVGKKYDDAEWEI